MKIIAQCDIPDELAQTWLQHLRDFDTMYRGCHFEVMMQTGATVPVREMVEALKVDPALTIEEVFLRSTKPAKKETQHERRTTAPRKPAR